MRLILLLLALTQLALAAPPNLVIINVDDLGYGDIGPFGSATATPNLDRMAKEGRKLMSHYGAPVCSPSRAALMTGCYPKRVLQIPHVLFPAAAVGLNPQEQNLARLLKGARYATACFGKWHLGDQREFLPLQQGFDVYFGIPYSNDMGPGEDGTKSNLGQPPRNPPGFKATKALETGWIGDQPPLALIEGNEVVGRVRQAEQATLTRRFTERATQFIREHRGGPFFLYLAQTAVHFPFYPSPEFHGKTPKLLTDMVSEIDWSTGQVLDTLCELGLSEKTLVIFTSDNGGSLPHGSSNGPLRGTKGQTLEGGIRVPTIAWWPGTVPAGTETRAITSMMDLLPTFATLGLALLSTTHIDGVNILPILKGDPNPPPRDHFFYFRGATLEAVRSGPWKLHLGSGELYQLENDLGEAKNVAAEHPDEVKKLRALAGSMRNDLGIDDFGPRCRPMGRVPNPRPLLE